MKRFISILKFLLTLVIVCWNLHYSMLQLNAQENCLCKFHKCSINVASILLPPLFPGNWCQGQSQKICKYNYSFINLFIIFVTDEEKSLALNVFKYRYKIINLLIWPWHHLCMNRCQISSTQQQQQQAMVSNQQHCIEKAKCFCFPHHCWPV